MRHVVVVACRVCGETQSGFDVAAPADEAPRVVAYEVVCDDCDPAVQADQGRGRRPRRMEDE